MATEKTRPPKRFTIGIGGGHREYNMNGITYVVSGNFADPAKAKGAETLADKFEHIVSDEFVDLSVEDEPQKANAPLMRREAKRENRFANRRTDT